MFLMIQLILERNEIYHHHNQKRIIAVGVRTEFHGEYRAKAIIVTSGTSMRGRIFIGKEIEESGGDNRPAANLLSESLEKLGFKLIRLKTGTPPRLDAASCNFKKCVEQSGETPAPLFSLRHGKPQRSVAKIIQKDIWLGPVSQQPSGAILGGSFLLVAQRIMGMDSQNKKGSSLGGRQYVHVEKGLGSHQWIQRRLSVAGYRRGH